MRALHDIGSQHGTVYVVSELLEDNGRVGPRPQFLSALPRFPQQAWQLTGARKLILLAFSWFSNQNGIRSNSPVGHYVSN